MLSRTGVCKPLFETPLSIIVGCPPRSGIDGSHGHSIVHLLMKCYVTVLFSCLDGMNLSPRPPPASPLTVTAAVGITGLGHSPDPRALPPRAGTPPTESSGGPRAQGWTNWVRGLEQAHLRRCGLMASEVTQTLPRAGIQHPITLI